MEDFYKKLTLPDRVLICILVIGTGIMTVSLFRGILGGSQVQVEYLERGGVIETIEKELFVDVEGAVERPGVYRLSNGARIMDALIAAGGFSATADRGFSEKNINLAQEVKDGQKIYVPEVGDKAQVEGYSEANSGQGTINVNTASMAELDTLWGVGEARSKSIVKNRPYETVEELVSKGVISSQILEKNRDLLKVY